MTRIVLTLAALLTAVSTASAQVSFIAIMTGAQETNGSGTFNLGDPDGFADANVTLTGATNTITWNVTYNNIAAPTLFHIHTGAFGTNGGIIIDFGVAPGGGVLSGTQVDPDVSVVLANPAGFYLNIHNANFPSGALRAQVPEPTSMALVGLAGAAGWIVRRRKKTVA